MRARNYIWLTILVAPLLLALSATAECQRKRQNYTHRYERCFTNPDHNTGMCWEVFCYDEETPIPPGFEQTPKREAEGRFCVWRRKW